MKNSLLREIISTTDTLAWFVLPLGISAIQLRGGIN
jgi:hypothetical protein